MILLLPLTWYCSFFFKKIYFFISCFRITDADESEEAQKVAKALASSRAAYEKLRQRAMVLRVAREQGWHVAKELATLQDQEEDPLLKKAMKNASRRLLFINFPFKLFQLFFINPLFFSNVQRKLRYLKKKKKKIFMSASDMGKRLFSSSAFRVGSAQSPPINLHYS